MKLTEHPVIAEIDAMLETVTDKQIERTEKRFEPLKDSHRALGIIVDPFTRKLVATAVSFRHLRNKHGVAAGNAADDEEELAEKALSARYDDLDDTCMQIVWILIRDELKLYGMEGTISLNAGWMVTEETPEKSADKLRSFLLNLGTTE